MINRQEDLERIKDALAAASAEVVRLTAGEVAVDRKENDDPVTVVDTGVDRLLREMLPREGEGWLSEETADDKSRLESRRVWVVDPLDGTREFVEGIPEWCISIGLVEEGRPVAGGICNPLTEETILGAEGMGVTLNGKPAGVTGRDTLEGAKVLASRSEVRKGLWTELMEKEFQVIPMGSVAYKLARVAAGLADATWSLAPKNEWDVAGGMALVLAGGGELGFLGKGASPVLLNRPATLLSKGLFSTSPGLCERIPECGH